MADIQRTLKIIFKGDDQVSKNVANISNSFSEFGKSALNVADELASFGKGVLKVDAALIGISATITALSIKTFAEFEQVMLQSKGILNLNTEEYNKFSEAAKNAGIATKYTATDAAKVLQELVKGGLNANQAMEQLIPTLNFVTASELQAGEATNRLLKIVNGTGQGIENLTLVSDKLVATANSTTTNVHELTEAFRKVGPVATGIGFNFDETSAALAALAKGGFVAEEGGTALRNIMIALIAPTEGAGALMSKLGVDTNELGINLESSQKALKSLGVEIKDSSGKIRPLSDILSSIKEGFAKLPDEADRAGAAALIFGKRGGAQMIELLKVGSDKVKEWEQTISKAAGTAKRIADVSSSGIKGSLQFLDAAIEGILISIGEKINKTPIDSLTGFFRNVVMEVNKGTFDPIFKLLDDVGKEISTKLLSITSNFPEAFKGIKFDNLIEAIKEAGSAISNLFGGIDLETPEGLRKAIQKIIDSLELFINASKGVINGMTPIIKLLVQAAEWFSNLDEETQKNIFTITGLATGISVLNGLFGGLISSVFSLGKSMVGLSGTLIEAGVSMAKLNPIIGSIIGTAGKGGLLGLAAAAGYAVGTLLNQFEVVQNFAQEVFRSIDKIINFTGQKGQLESVFNFEQINKIGTERLKNNLALAGKVRTEIIDSQKEAQKGIDIKINDISGIKEIKQIPLIPEIDPVKEKVVNDKIDKFKEDKTIQYQVELEKAQLQKSTEDLKTQSDFLKRMMELKVELDVKQAEIQLEGFKTSVEATVKNIDTLTGSIDDLFKIDTSGDLGKRSAIMQQLDEENRLRQEAFELEKQLLEAQLEERRIKNELLSDTSRSLIEFKIDPAISPDLDEVVRKIIARAQIIGNEQGLAALLGQ